MQSDARSIVELENDEQDECERNPLGEVSLPANRDELLRVASIPERHSGLRAHLGPAMFNVILKRPTNTLAISSCMAAGLAVAVRWRMLGYNEMLNESLPGFLTGLVVHDIVVRLTGSKKQAG